jgi:hypothetical protein
MKKYLMTVMAAVTLGGLFAGCSKDADMGGGENSAEFNIVQNYENAFITRFGQPAETQTWGFGEIVAGTRGHNANANEWADPDKEYGGWVVPDPLTDDQKLRVKAYFQAIQYPGGTNCNYTDFFVQQVYKGNPSTAGSNSPEQYKSANNGWVVGSNHMDHLTAGSIHDHINNFNYGDYSGGGTVTVLDNGQHVNGGSTHQDQIMLMVNSQTDCFGYWNSDGSLGHDDRYRLVSAEVIDQWAKDYGNNIGAAVVDKWNRSFIGFDFDQIAGDDVYVKTNVREENGEKKYDLVYAKYSDASSLGCQYGWDGQKAVPMNSIPGTADLNITSDFDGFWNGSESKSQDGEGIITYNAKANGGLRAWYFGTNFEFSKYVSVVVEFAESPKVSTKIIVEEGDGNGIWNTYVQEASANVTQIEFNLTDKNISSWNIDHYIRQIALQAGGDDALKIRSIYLKGKPGVEGLGDITYNGKQIPYLVAETNEYCGDLIKLNDTDLKTNQYVAAVNSNQDCLNLSKINEMLAGGYLPVSGSNLKDWVKVGGGADGYYSDWIVTICKANESTTPPPPIVPPTDPDGIVCRIIVEDLTVGENSDFDFNDVVFDVCQNGTLIIRAIGGELPIYIGAENTNEVHAVCSITLPTSFNEGKDSHLVMRNTGWKSTGSSKEYEGIDYDADLGHITLGRTFNTPAEAKEIGIWVKKNGTNIKLQAPKGKVASMVCVGTDYEWCAERQDIDAKYHKGGVKLFRQYVIGDPNYQGDWKDKDAWYHKMNQ